MLRKILLACGVVSSALYVAMNVLVPLRDPGYHVASQTVSELSAVGAATRPLWVALAVLYGILLIAFGWGVRLSAGGSRALRMVGYVIMAQGIIGFFWPPMHLRGAEFTLTDTLHIVFSVAWLLLMLTAIGFGAAALGRPFRLYSLATLAVFLVFGTLTGAQGPRVAANLPTPWIGVWERINIAAAMLWIAVLAVSLLRKPTPTALSSVARA